MPDALAHVWVFNGAKWNLASAVFSSRSAAEEWISTRRLTGMLTQYPLDISVYDWVVENGLFHPKDDRQKSAAFIQGFSSAYLEHYHYEDGKHLEETE
jgi:hypothetical protein